MKEVYPDYVNTTAFRWFGQDDGNSYVYPIYFDADIVQGTDYNVPVDKMLDGKLITGVGLVTKEDGSSWLNLYPKNAIDYVPVTRAQAALFEMNLRDYVPGKVAEELVWENFPLSRLADQELYKGNYLKTHFKFSTDNSFIKKTGATAITAPFVIVLVFLFDRNG